MLDLKPFYCCKSEASEDDIGHSVSTFLRVKTQTDIAALFYSSVGRESQTGWSFVSVANP